MASALNFNTVWTSLFEPIPTFAFPERFARESELGARHDFRYHIVGSDAAGVVIRTGPGVTRWRPGDLVPDVRNGAAMKQGDIALIWGATGGLGGCATQLVRNGGGIPSAW